MVHAFCLFVLPVSSRLSEWKTGRVEGHDRGREVNELILRAEHGAWDRFAAVIAAASNTSSACCSAAVLNRISSLAEREVNTVLHFFFNIYLNPFHRKI